jgi:hypothetical protein
MPLLCWLLVVAKQLSPQGASAVPGIVAPVALVGFLLIPIIESRCARRTQPALDGSSPLLLEKLLLTWTRASLVAQLGWELPFILCSSWLVNVRAGDHWAWLFWTYGAADHRYLDADSFVVAMESVTVLAGGAAQICALRLYGRGNRQGAALLGICIGVTQLYGTVLYFGTEALNRFKDIDVNDPVNLWLKFVLLNAIWLVMPVVSVAVLAVALYRNHPRLGSPQRALDSQRVLSVQQVPSDW